MNSKVTPLTEAEAKALMLKTVVEGREYQETLGQWLKEELNLAISQMAEATEHFEVYKAQGSYASIQGLLHRIDATLSKANQEQKKRVKILHNKE